MADEFKLKHGEHTWALFSSFYEQDTACTVHAMHAIDDYFRSLFMIVNVN